MGDRATSAVGQPVDPPPAEVPGTQAIARALDILSCFSFEDPELSLNDLCDRLGFARSTIHRIVALLVARRFLDFDRATGRYRVGPAAAQLGGVFLSQFSLRDIAAPQLDALLAKHQQTVLLAQRDGQQIIYIDKREGSRSLRVSSRVLRTRPFVYGGLARAMLARLDDETVRALVPPDALKPFGPASFLDYGAFLQSVERARRDGYYLEVEEVTEGVYSLSAPIVGRVTGVLAAIGVVGPTIHLEGDLANGLQQDVVQAAAEISAQLP